MNETEKNQEPIDPRLVEMLESLRSTPEREKDAAARSRAKFMAQAESFAEQETKAPFGWLTRWLNQIPLKPKERNIMNLSNRRFALTALATVLVLAVLLFGGAGVTAFAAQSALPGDALYSLKTGIEQTQITLSRDAYNRAELQLSFAERRLDEISALIGEGRFNDIGRAVEEFESQVQAAISELQAVAAGDPARATELASQISAALSRYALTLSGMLDSVPEAVRSEMERAISASQGTGVVSSGDEFEFKGTVMEITPEAWVVGEFTVAITTTTEIKDAIVVGDLVKVHAYEDPDGVLTAREIELAMDEVVDEEVEFTGTVMEITPDAWVVDEFTVLITTATEIEDGIVVGDVVKVHASKDVDGVLTAREIKLSMDDDNANTNDNDNDDDNMNANDNDNDNTNINANDNDNDDDNMNANDNDNGNTNNNSNDNSNNNDNENHNSNSNSNSNDNSNSNNNGNVNSNGNDNEPDDD